MKPYVGSGVVVSSSVRGDMQQRIPLAGSLVRGVVLKVYTYGEQDPLRNTNYNGIYADVLAYGQALSSPTIIIRRALVATPKSGVYEGDIWIPRPASQNIQTQQALDLTQLLDPRQLDGDHVLLGFIDGTLTTPVIVAQLPHPQVGRNLDDSAELGTRVKVLNTEEAVRYWRHHGTFFGVDADGNFDVDTRGANDGYYSGPRGTEQQHVADGAHGNFTITIPDDALIKLGSSVATEALVLGDAYTAAREPALRAVADGLRALSAAVTALQTLIAGPALQRAPDPTNANAAQITAATNLPVSAADSAASALDNFEDNNADYLSPYVKTL
jgi:hypothetical protein